MDGLLSSLGRAAIAPVRIVGGKVISDARWLAGVWDRFWFTPSSPAALGFLRIIGGLMLVYTHAVWGLRLEEFFGPSGWQDPELVSAYLADSTAYTFWLYVPNEWLWTVHWSCLAILALFTLGLWTRVTSILSVIIVISYVNRAPLANFGLDQINVLLTVYLALGPCGATLSLDRLWARYRAARKALVAGSQPVYPPIRPTVAANLSLRMIEVHMAILYFWAGLSKLKGYSWWDGTALWMGAANYEYQAMSLTWMAWYPWIYNFLTHATVLWEMTFFLTVCHPRLRPYSLLAGASMHLGIGAFMGMWTFGLVMIFTYVSYMPAAWAEAAQRSLAGWLTGRPRTVVYRLHGWLSRLWAGCLATLDGENRLRFRAADDYDTNYIEAMPIAAARNERVSPDGTPLTPNVALLSPGEWWRQLREQEQPTWGALRAPDGRPGDGSVLVVGGSVSWQASLQGMLRRDGYTCRVASDVPTACMMLSARKYDTVLLLCVDPEELADAEFLRNLCLSGAETAPATVLLLAKPLVEWFEGGACRDHRVVVSPCSSSELRAELALAREARGWPVPDRQPALAEQPA